MKQSLFYSTWIVIAGLFFYGCGPSQADQAQQKINKSNTLLAQGDTASALLMLDAISKSFPDAKVEINKASAISDKIYNAELSRAKENLLAASAVIQKLLPEFKAEKGEFEKSITYIPNRQVFDKSWARSFIQASLNEKGDLTLASNYYGEQWIDHTFISITTELTSINSDPVALDNFDCHHSEFGGSKWEKISYRGKQAELVIAAIAANYEHKIKATFKGKNTYIMWLEDYDKKSIKLAWDLAKALKLKRKSEISMAALGQKIKVRS